MANPTAQNDKLGSQTGAGFSTAFDWKGAYVSELADEGYERFSQFSASPDSTALFAGPARFTGLAGNIAGLTPIGLSDGFSMQANPSLARLYEIGSNRAFFTRGKTSCSASLGKILADQQNILAALSAQAYRPVTNSEGMKAPGATAPNPNIMMNLDSEYFAVPFGLLVLFKTRGGGGGNGKILTAVYCEYCMFSNYSITVGATAPVIMEGIGIEFDRVVPVALSN